MCIPFTNVHVHASVLSLTVCLQGSMKHDERMAMTR